MMMQSQSETNYRESSREHIDHHGTLRQSPQETSARITSRQGNFNEHQERLRRLHEEPELLEDGDFDDILDLSSEQTTQNPFLLTPMDSARFSASTNRWNQDAPLPHIRQPLPSKFHFFSHCIYIFLKFLIF